MIYFLLASCILTFMFLYIFQDYFVKNNYYDKINLRSSHTTKATRVGGISIFFSLFVITIYLYFQTNEIFDFSLFIPLGILALIGLYDDVYQLDFKLKFLFQLIVAKIIIDQGIYFTSLGGLFGIYEISYLVSQPLTIIFILTIINAHNFCDGIDGLAITESLKTFVIIILLVNYSDIRGITFITYLLVLPLVILYYFNFRKKNKVFLGDSGSLFLGLLIAISIINLSSNNQIIGEEINIISLIFICYLYPLIDMIRVVFIRLKNKKSPFTADRNHIHHFLIARGFSHIISTLIISFSSLFLQIIIYLLVTN